MRPFEENRAGLAQSIQYHTLLTVSLGLPLLKKRAKKNDRQKSYEVCCSKKVTTNVTLFVVFKKIIFVFY